MPGGVGTLAELAVMWNEEIISTNSSRPMILVGPGWKKTITVFLAEQGDYLHLHDQKRVFLAQDIHEAVSIIDSLTKNVSPISTSGQIE